MNMKRWIEQQGALGRMVSVTYQAGMWDILMTDGPMWCETRKRAQGKTFSDARQRIETQSWQPTNYAGRRALMTAESQSVG